MKKISEHSPTLGDGSITKGEKTGEADKLLSKIGKADSEGYWMRPAKVLYLEGTGLSLLSTSALNMHNIHTTFKTSKCYLPDGYIRNSIGAGPRPPDTFCQMLGTKNVNPAIKDERVSIFR